jgi:hypothetical protein
VRNGEKSLLYEYRDQDNKRVFISDQFGTQSCKIFDDISLTFQKHALISSITDAFTTYRGTLYPIGGKTKPGFILFNVFWKRPTNTGIHLISTFSMGDEKDYRKLHHSIERSQVADTGYGLQRRKTATSRH